MAYVVPGIVEVLEPSVQRACTRLCVSVVPGVAALLELSVQRCLSVVVYEFGQILTLPLPVLCLLQSGWWVSCLGAGSIAVARSVVCSVGFDWHSQLALTLHPDNHHTHHRLHYHRPQKSSVLVP